MFRSLRTQLTLLFLVLTIVPLIIVGSLVSQQGSTVLQQESINLLDQLAQRTSISLRAFFDERENELLVLRDIYGFTSLQPSAQQDVLATLLSKQPAYYQLALINAAGQQTLELTRGQLISTGDSQNQASNPLFQRALQTGEVGFSQVYFDEGARDRLVQIAVPMQNLVAGTIDQVLMGALRFRNVEESVLRELNLAEGEEVFIVDNQGIIVAHQQPNLVLRQTVFDLPEAEGRNPGLAYEDAILATDALQLGDLNLITVAETSYAQATELAFDLTQLAAAVTVVTLLLAAVAVTFAVNRVVRPIVRLSRAAQAIQAGDFSQRIDLHRQDEVGQLAVGFNQMADAVEKRELNLHEQADELRIATARAREAARVKGEFLANVSHELRTPLNAIIGFSDMLLAGMSGPLNDKQTHKMERLKENGMRLLALINDLLDLTRIESGRLETIQKPFSPRMVAIRITAQMEGIAEQSNLRFSTMISPNVPETIIGDEKRVEQVIVNLLSNAFKFTKEGSVTLSLDANRAEHMLYLEVTDTGIGIPPHALNVIFEEFRQLDGSYSRAYKGSGLGLSITRNLVRMMGGRIGVKSTQGVGSIFTVMLPLNLQISAKQAVLETVTG